jgi:hypothetical protein
MENTAIYNRKAEYQQLSPGVSNLQWSAVRFKAGPCQKKV